MLILRVVAIIMLAASLLYLTYLILSHRAAVRLARHQERQENFKRQLREHLHVHITDEP